MLHPVGEIGVDLPISCFNLDGSNVRLITKSSDVVRGRKFYYYNQMLTSLTAAPLETFRALENKQLKKIRKIAPAPT
jgi:hypothetical protein